MRLAVNKFLFVNLMLIAAIFTSANARDRDAGFLFKSIAKKKIGIACALYPPDDSSAALASVKMADAVDRSIKNRRMTWRKIPHGIDTLLNSLMPADLEDCDTVVQLPDTVANAMKLAGFDYVVLPYGVHAERYYDSSFTLTDATRNGRYRITFAFTVIDLAKNASVFTWREDTKFCKTDPWLYCGDLVVDGILKLRHFFSAAGRAFSNVSFIPREKHDRILQNVSSTGALFGLGSILTIASSAIVVTGDDGEARPVGLSLFAAGQTGLLLCGVSNLSLNRHVIAENGEGVGGLQKGWIVQAVSWLFSGAGAALSFYGNEHDNTGMIVSGLSLMGGSLAITTYSWALHSKSRRQLKRAAGVTVSALGGIKYDIAEKAPKASIGLAFGF